MPMEGTELHRFEMLSNEFVDLPYVHDYYTLDDPRENPALLRAIERFKPGGLFRGDTVSRYTIEMFLQKNRVLPRAWMAARIGLQREYFNQLLPRIVDLLPRPSYTVHEHLIDESLIDDCVNNLSSLRFRTFSDHESFCRRLHEAIAQEVQEPIDNIHAHSLWCATDQWLAAHDDGGDYPRRYAQYFDCITCDPVSLAHAMWLNFDKPMSLGPDRCSKLTYVRYHAQLGDHFAGTREPDDLARYSSALEVAAG